MSENRSTPRVAESLDDLAVGMVVAWVYHPGGRVLGGEVVSQKSNLTIVEREGGRSFFSREDRAPDGIRIFILADPPAPPAHDWLVPADTMEALQEALIEWDAKGGMTSLGDVVTTVRAVLDAATEVER